MLSFDATQLALVAGAHKIRTWLFDIENYYIDYDNQSGKFTVGDTITGANTSHTAVIEAIKRVTAVTGRLYISSPSGIFQDSEELSDGTNTADAVGTRQGSTYNWSTKTWTSGGYDSYTYKIIRDSFNSVTLQNNLSEVGMYSPNTLEFALINKDDALTASHFLNSRVKLSLVISDGIDTETIGQWKYITSQANPYYERIQFACEDFVAKNMAGEYPSTPLVDDLFSIYTSTPEETDSSAFCVPVIFGSAYIPLVSIPYSDYLRGYVLGDDQATFTVTEITSPRKFGALQSWQAAAADFRIVTQTDRFTPSRDWSILHPFLVKKYNTDYAGTHTAGDHGTICTDSTKAWTNSELLGLRVLNITDSSVGYITANDATTFTASLSGGSDDSWDTNDEYEIENSGLWKDGDSYESPLVKYSSSVTSGMTSPADVIEQFLKDINIASVNIDSAGSFTTSDSTYTTWTLEFNGGYYTKKSIQAVLSSLLNQCHSVLDVTDKVELRTLSKASQKTVTSADIVTGTFTYELLVPSETDSGYIRFQEPDKPQDVLTRLIVPAKANIDFPSSEEIILDLVQDTQDVQKLGTLHFQKKYGKEAAIGFSSKSTLLGLQPNDTITINDAKYGGNYKVVIDTVTIRNDLTMDFTCTKYKYDLDDFTDLSPSVISFTSDIIDDYWTMLSVGPTSVTPTSGIPANSLPGRLIIGDNSNYILIDPYLKRIVSSNYVSGVFGAGFILDEDLLEVGNIACRGIFRMAVFQTDVLSVVGGNVAILPGDVLDTDMTSLDASTLKIEGNETFAVGDILRMKDSGNDEWAEVTNIGSAPIYTVTRDRGGSYSANNNPTWPKGTAVVNYMQSGDGGVYLTSSETNAPYIQVFTHAGAPWSAVTTQARLGNLNGSYGISGDKYGFAAGDSALGDHYILINATDGTINMKGSINITGGDGAVNLSDYSGGVTDLDDMNDGPATYGRVLLTSITAGAIIMSAISGDLDDISNGTYGKILTSQLTAGVLQLSQAGGDLDDIADGTYGKVLNASLTAGGLVLTSALSGTVGASTIITAGTITVTQMGTGSVDYDEIATNAVRAAEINASGVDTSEIASGACEADEINANAVDTSEINTSAVTTTQIDGGTIVTGDIAATTILAGNIAANTISTGQIAASGVDTDELAASSVYTGEIYSNTILAGDIASQAVATDEIKADTILAGDIATNAIKAAEIDAGAVDASEITASAVRADEIQTNAVNASEINSGQVFSDEIAATTIVAGDIFGNTISTGQIAASGVDTDELAASSVYTGEIYTNTILAGDIAAGAVDTDELAADCITAVELDAGCITAASVGTNEIIANSANFANLIVTTAKIGNLQVATGKVAGNAITINNAATNAAGNANSGTTVVQTVSITSTGVDVFVWAQVRVNPVAEAASNATFRLYESTGSGTLSSVQIIEAIWSGDTFTLSLCGEGNYAAGTRTFKLSIAFSGSSAIAYSSASVMVLEMKK